MLLSELLSADRIKVPLRGLTKNDLLRELVDLVAPTADQSAREAILAAVQEREQLLSTGIGSGVAIPHGKTPVVDQLLMAAGVASRPVDFDALDGQPVQLFFLLVGPENASGAHVKALSRISRLLRRDTFRQRLVDATSSEEFYAVLSEAESS